MGAIGRGHNKYYGLQMSDRVVGAGARVNGEEKNWTKRGEGVAFPIGDAGVLVYNGMALFAKHGDAQHSPTIFGVR